MKHTKPILALLMAGVLLTVAVGCDVGTPIDTTTADTATTTYSGPTICPYVNSRPYKIPEDLNFSEIVSDPEDLIVRVAYVEGTNGDYTRRSLKADELDESHVGVKLRERDARLKELLGLELAVDCVSPSITGMEQALGSSLAAGTCEYDILAGYQYLGMSMAWRGFLLNLADLTEHDADYIDLNAPYWAIDYNEAMSYKGVCNWITGDLALRYIGGAYCTFVNTDLYSQYLEPLNGSIYDLVKDNNWTLDSIIALEKQYESIKWKDKTDVPYFFGYEPNDMIDGLVIGAAVPFTQKDADTGEITLVFGNTDTNYREFGEKLEVLLRGSEASHEYADQEGANVMTAFAEGRVMFTVNKLYFAESYLHEMEDYTVLPMPKLNADQKNYRTTVHDGCTLFGITHCSSRVRQAAAALEFLCAESYQIVTPQFYETVSKGKYSRDPQAAEMYDLIRDGTTTDFAVAWGQSMNSLIHYYRDYDDSLDRTIARNREDWEKDLAELTKHPGVYAEAQQ